MNAPPEAGPPHRPVETGRLQVVGVSVALFLLTFGLYWSLGPKETVFDYPVSQALNLIHGHLDLTERYTKHIGILERVLYDGEGFCLPANDPRGVVDIENPRISADCRTYMQHALGPAFLLIPSVLVWGADVNQTLVSIFFAALTAPVVYAITRRFSDSLRTQLALSVLVMFGTVLWWAGSNGGVWTFAHTTAVFFLFCAIYATVVLRSPVLAGAMVGAAFMCRPTTLLAAFFPFVALSDQWLTPVARDQPRWRALKTAPLVLLAAGIAPFVVATATVNYLRFDNPFEAGYGYGEQLYQTGLRDVYSHGLFAIDYVARHSAVFWEQMPIFAREGSYVWPSWAGLAMWATTPPLFYALFVHLKEHRRLALAGAAAIALACAVVLTRAIWRGLVWGEWGTLEIPLNMHLLPYWLMIGLAIGAAVTARDRLVVASWAAIIPLAIANSLFAATGWAQFGYRYGLDFMPFLFLLVVIAVGRQVRRHHLALIALAVLVNLWGVLWIYQFDPLELWGWTWVSF